MADEPLTLRQWTDVIRRARLGRTVKAVALMLATYADADGRRVFPGVARVAIDCELGYNAVQTAFADLRKAGLIKLVRPAARRGDADEYRLTLGADVLEHVEILSPAQVKVAAAKLSAAKRGRYRRQQTDPDPLHPSGMGAGDGAEPDLHHAGMGADPVDNPDLHPSAEGAEPVPEPEPAPIGAGAEPDLHPSARATCTHRRDHPPPTTDVTRTTSQPVNGVRTHLAVVGDTGPPQDPDSECVDSRCSRGFVLTADERIERCAHPSHAPPANVIPLPIRRTA